MTHADLRLLLASALYWIATIAALVTGPGPVIACTVLATVLWLAIWSIRRHVDPVRARFWRPTVMVMAAVACMASLVTGVHQQARHGPLLEAASGRVVTLHGTVGSYPSISDQVYRLLDVDGLDNGEASFVTRGSVRLVGDDELAEIPLGAHLSVRVSLEPAGTVDEQVGWGRILHIDNVVEPDGIAGVIARAASRLDEHLKDEEPGPRGLVPGLAIGDDSKLPPESDEAMMAVNLTHLTAVSGAHVSMLCAIVLLLVGAKHRLASVLACAGTLLVLLIATGWQPSVMRAGVMGGVVLLALYMRRPSSALPALGVAIFALLVTNPYMALSYGFILSAVSTGAIILLSTTASELIEPLMGTVLARLMAVPIVAHLACGPIVATLSPTASLWSALANALAAPVVPIGTVSSLAALLLSSTPLVHPCLQVAVWSVTWIDTVGRTLAAWPGSGLPSWTVMVVYATLLGAGWLMGRAFLTWSMILAAGCGAIIAYLLPARGHWDLLVCDVGQGTAVVVRHEGTDYLIDTGTAEERLSACLRRYRASPDVLILSHLHDDHMGHAPRLSQTAATYVSTGLSAQAASLGITVAGELQAGQRLGPFEIISPAGARSCDSSSCDNDQSLVLRLDHHLLLTGDIEEETQARLARTEMATNIVIVPHHGSPRFAENFVEAARASLAIITVGDNTYGHPAPVVVKSYERFGQVVTTLDGDMSFDMGYWESERDMGQSQPRPDRPHQGR